MLEIVVFLDEIVILRDTASPAQSPVSDQSVEDTAVKFERLVEATVQVIQSHLVLVLVLEQQTEMTSDGEEKVVVERWQMLKLTAQYLRDEAFVGNFCGQL